MADNLQLRCRAHNLHDAQQCFGVEQASLIREHAAPPDSVRTELLLRPEPLEHADADRT